MELNEANLSSLALQLQQTLHPDFSKRKSAEVFLRSLENNQGFSLLLLALIGKADVDMVVRLSAAIAFKNFINRNWKNEDNDNAITVGDRNLIKTQIVDLMTSMPETIQRQLGQAISIIGKEDFPEKWPELITNMVDKFQSGDFRMINGVLQTAQSIFQRYRHEFKSDRLWSEIKFVLENFAQPFTQLFKGTMQLATQYSNDQAALNIIIHSLTLITEIFYSLNYQDLPEFFEDNMAVWMQNFLALLELKNTNTTIDGEDVLSPLDILKTRICESITLYAQKYDDEFKDHIGPFVQAVWNILTTSGPSLRFDSLVTQAIEFLATVIRKPQYGHLFSNPQIYEHICGSIVIPNMELRECDIETFEDNPFEYIRMDMEASDVGTRRKAASDMIKALKFHFDGQKDNPLTRSFHQFVRSLLDRYATDRIAHWKSKDLAIYLLSSLQLAYQTSALLTEPGRVAFAPLVNAQNEALDMEPSKFFATHVYPELARPLNSELPVVQADCIKYLTLFRTVIRDEDEVRNQLIGTDDVITSSTRHVILKFLTSPSIVVHSYAAIFLERVMVTKRPDTQIAILKPEQLKDSLPMLVENLFKAMTIQGSTENEYLMKALMRTVSTFKNYINPLAQPMAIKLAEVLARVCKNPSKPYFNHYLFETLCLIIQTVPNLIPSFEDPLLITFQDIMKNDVQEFMPYVFQELAAMVENYPCPPEGKLPSKYGEIFPSLLLPLLWDNKPGNVPALVRLLTAFLLKSGQEIGEGPKLSSLLGVFQKLLSSKATDHEGMRLLQYIFAYVPRDKLEPFVKQIFFLLFQRLQAARTPKYVKCLIVFLCFFVTRYDASYLYNLLEGIQPGMFVMTVQKVIVPELENGPKSLGDQDRRICALGITSVLTKCPQFKVEQYPELWCALLEGLIKLLEQHTSTTTISSIPSMPANLSDSVGHGLMENIEKKALVAGTESLEGLIDPPLDEEYRAAFARLYSLAEPRLSVPGQTNGLASNVVSIDSSDPKIYLAKMLMELSHQSPAGQMEGMLSKMSSQTRNTLQNYMQSSNMTL